MKVIDSRRLTGPSLLLDAPGAILDVQLDDRLRDRALAAWREAAARLLDQVGWPGQRLATRGFTGGASLAFTAPPDALYAATEVNEAAWAEAWARVEGRTPEREEIVAASLRQAIADERNPTLMALREGARAREVTFLAGEGLVSVGSGTWSQVWPSTELPRAEAVDWLHVHDIPVALVTGSNGKTTVVRLLAAIASAAAYAAGITSTDGVSVKGVSLAEGDYSGPSGARLLLRRRDVQLAVLETARGGLLRRGLSVDRAAVAVVTNVADDHLGEFGIQDLETLADVKMLVTRALRPGAAAVLNGDDPRVRARGERLGGTVIWFTLEPDAPWLAGHLQSGGRAAVYDDRALILAEGSRRITIAEVDAVPIAVGGAARHNVANALAAVGAAAALGLPTPAITRGLARFGSAEEENVGRANVMELGGVQVVVDYAHNPHGMAAIVELVKSLPGERRLLVLGQAGDRSDEAIRELAQTAWRLKPDQIVIKELPEMLRGRQPGEVPAVLRDELLRLGAAPGSIIMADTELQGIREAFTWARPGDLLILLTHTQRDEVLALLDRLRDAGWRAGEPLPV